MEPRIQYAKTSDGVNIAYAVFGDGPSILFTPAFSGGVHLYSRFSLARRSVDDLVTRGWRVVRYDGRGTGSSDRERMDFSVEALVLDTDAVVAGLGLEVFALASATGAAAPAVAYAVRYPERVSALILRNPVETDHELYPRVPWVRAERALQPIAEEQWGLFCKSMAHLQLRFANNEIADELAEAYRTAITPTAFLAQRNSEDRFDYSILEAVTVPTLVIDDASIPGFSLESTETRAITRKVAAQIPGARLVTTEDYSTAVDAFLREGQRPAASAESALPSGMTAILFADIADSTVLTERLGDTAFRAKARDLDTALRTIIREHAGTPIEGKLLGDGVLAVFTSARQAIEAALACARSGDDGGLPLHLGLHAGDVIREENNVYGGAVNIAARISGLSAPSEVLVSETVRSLARTSAGVRFEDRGQQALKGVGEPVRVWAVVTQEQGTGNKEQG